MCFTVLQHIDQSVRNGYFLYVIIIFIIYQLISALYSSATLIFTCTLSLFLSAPFVSIRLLEVIKCAKIDRHFADNGQFFSRFILFLNDCNVGRQLWSVYGASLIHLRTDLHLHTHTQNEKKNKQTYTHTHTDTLRLKIKSFSHYCPASKPSHSVPFHTLLPHTQPLAPFI